MSSERMVPISRDTRARDILEDGTDVTDELPRSLVLRAVNSTIRTETALGRVLGELGEVSERIGKLERSERTMRDRVDSVPDVHDVEATVEKVRAEFAQVIAQKDLELAQKELERERALRQADLDRQTEARKSARDLRIAIIGGSFAAVATALAAHWIH